MADKYAVNNELKAFSKLKVSQQDDETTDDADEKKSVKSYTSKFKNELDKTELSIFHPIADCGYFGWKTMNKAYRALSKIRSTDEIIRHIDIHLKPKEVLPITHLKLPCSFDMSLPPKLYRNKYPCGQY
jgi:hypothetical protein